MNCNISHAFKALEKQIKNIAQHEVILATFAGEDFLNLLRPVANFLSENTTRTYCSYLEEAKDLILKGTTEMEVYEYFISKMRFLQADTTPEVEAENIHDKTYINIPVKDFINLLKTSTTLKELKESLLLFPQKKEGEE